MQTSESITNLAAALIGFHKEVSKIPKDAKNPFFKSKYASLSGILDAITEPLINNGLSLTQFPEGENGLSTRLLHTSGEWMESTYVMKPVKDTPQDRGSAITYQRRYAVGAILSLNIDDDDDGNKASARVQVNGNEQKPTIKVSLDRNEEIKGAVKQIAVFTNTKDLSAFCRAQPDYVQNNPSFQEHAKDKRASLTPQTV